MECALVGTDPKLRKINDRFIKYVFFVVFTVNVIGWRKCAKLGLDKWERIQKHKDPKLGPQSWTDGWILRDIYVSILKNGFEAHRGRSSRQHHGGAWLLDE